MKKTMYEMHEKYNSHDKHVVCECGRVRNSFTLSDIKELPNKNIRAILENPKIDKTLIAIITGILATDENKLKILKEFKGNPIVNYAIQEAELNRKALKAFSTGLIFQYFEELYSERQMIPHKLKITTRGYGVCYDLMEVLGMNGNISPYTYLLIRRKIKCKTGVFATLKYLEGAYPYAYIAYKPRTTMLKEYIKYCSNPEIVTEYIRKNIVLGKMYNGTYRR